MNTMNEHLTTYGIIGDRLAEITPGVDNILRLQALLRGFRDSLAPLTSSTERDIAAWNAIIEELDLRHGERAEHLADVAEGARLRREAVRATAAPTSIGLAVRDTCDVGEPLPACVLIPPACYASYAPQARTFLTFACPVAEMVICLSVDYAGEWHPFRFQTDGGGCGDSFCEGPVQPHESGRCCANCAEAIRWTSALVARCNLAGAPHNTVSDILNTLYDELPIEEAETVACGTGGVSVLTEVAR